MMIIVADKDCKEILEYLELMGEKAYQIGFIEKKDGKQEQVCLSEN
jgi:phosphoribosylaminoimidazole (AIR) synthetase